MLVVDLVTLGMVAVIIMVMMIKIMTEKMAPNMNSLALAIRSLGMRDVPPACCFSEMPLSLKLYNAIMVHLAWRHELRAGIAGGELNHY